MIEFEKIKSIIVNTLGEEVLIADGYISSPIGIRVQAKKILEVCTLMYSHELLFFDYLSSITGIDNGEANGTMEVIYHLHSIPNDQSIAINTVLDRVSPQIDSVTSIWKSADWHERETYDFFGITFNNHPDLRRILLPADWEGYPMRKDYEEQQYYHGVKVKYE